MRGIFKLLAGIVVALAVVWAGLWWYAQTRLQAVLKAYAAEMTPADGSSSLSYDRISGGGFPFSAKATIANPNLTVPLPGSQIPGPLALNVAYVTLRIDLLNPLVLHIDVPDKITGHVPQGEGAVTFTSFDATAKLSPAALFNPHVFAVSGVDTTITGVNVLASSGSLQVLHIDSIRTHQAVLPSASPAQTGLTLTEDFQGISLPGWLTQLLRVPFKGQVAHLGINLALSGPLDWPALSQQLQATPQGPERTRVLVNALHGWANQGGNGTGSLNLVAGPTTLSAAGTVKFDTNVQPNGTVDVTADHLDALTAAITASYPQAQDSINQIEAQLAPYISASATGGQELTIHATYGSSGIMANGTKLGEMPPLDWSLLTSPPPAQAPGDGSGAAAGTNP
ncbi:DUF2125 domain-containing protein [Acidocella aromatica]|uniref:DUF2125 domain-containing protein n=1 Tax=Acidocella aromatica TaxID=1303579 RepID=A0A840V9A4_9PROT|nr:DUF2125 domain-containing protein [Acidocella aromatica]MBB5372084.1 hypothetical protein [Acidocella aromatica]